MARLKLRRMKGGSLEPQVGGSGGLLNTLLIVVLIGVLVFVGYQIYIMNKSGNNQQTLKVVVDGGGMGSAAMGDDRYTQAPKPMRTWRAPPDMNTWNPTTLPTIATRGLPESFQTVGLLQYPGGDVKPLYGRRTAGSNDRWNYYTRTDTYNPVPIPLSQGRRDCMEDTGCNEVFDGDNLKSLNGEQTKVKLYKMNGPTYIAGV
jgi:hypothetical protein